MHVVKYYNKNKIMTYFNIFKFKKYNNIYPEAKTLLRRIFVTLEDYIWKEKKALKIIKVLIGLNLELRKNIELMVPKE